MIAESILVIFTCAQMNYFQVLENWTDKTKQHNMLFLYLMGEVSNIFIYATFLFNGLCKFKGAIEGRKQV